MQKIVRALLDHKGERLWYSELKRLVRNPEYLGPMVSDSSYREALRKLGEVPVIVTEEPSSSKKKKLLITLLPEVVNESSLPESYLSGSIESAFDQARDPVEHASRKLQRKTEKLRKITQSMLFRANSGAAYSRRVKNSEAGPGQVVSFKHKKGHWYYNEYIEANLTAEQMNELIPISSEFDTVDGISVADLVCLRDVGLGRVFRDLNVSIEEVENVAKQLVNKGYLRQMSRDEISKAIKSTGKPALYELLKKEKRYKVATDVLQEYIYDLTDLLYFITRRVRAARMTVSKGVKAGNDWYRYYYGKEALENLLTYEKTEQKRRLTSGGDGVTKVATPFGVIPEYRPRKKESYVSEIREWDKYIRNKLVKLKLKKEYANIINEYPLLHKILLQMVKPVSKSLRLDINLIRTN